MNEKKEVTMLRNETVYFINSDFFMKNLETEEKKKIFSNSAFLFFNVKNLT